MNKNKKISYEDNIWEACPMGFLHDGLIECYYFGIVKIKECNECSHRNK